MVPKTEDRQALVRELVGALNAAGAPTAETERRLETLFDLIGVRPVIAEPAAIADPRPKVTAVRRKAEKVTSGPGKSGRTNGTPTDRGRN
jgi:hypothetical protein